MVLLNATNLDRKSGIRGPKTMGEAQRKHYLQTHYFVPLSQAISRPHTKRNQGSSMELCFRPDIKAEGDASMAKRFLNGYLFLARWLDGPISNRAKRIEYSLFTLESRGRERLPMKLLINPQPPFERRLLLESMPFRLPSRQKRSAAE
jgi:hypothetical protein